MKRVLLAYDGSRGADAALAALSAGLNDDNLEVMVLSVAEVWVPPDGTSDVANETRMSEELRAARSRALAAVHAQEATAARAAQRLRTRHPQWTVHAVTVAGPPGPVIASLAAEWPADLVMLGDERRSWLQRLLFRSISRHVLKAAPCSVQIVPAPEAAPPRKPAPHRNFRPWLQATLTS